MEKKSFEDGSDFSNVMVNVNVKIDRDTLSNVLVEVLRNGEVAKNLGKEALEKLVGLAKKKD